MLRLLPRPEVVAFLNGESRHLGLRSNWGFDGSDRAEGGDDVGGAVSSLTVGGQSSGVFALGFEGSAKGEPGDGGEEGSDETHDERNYRY